MVVVGFTEKAFLNHKDADGFIIFIVMLSIVTFLALIARCQKCLLISYTITYTYIVIRFYFYYTGDILNWLRFCAYYLISLVSIFWLSRIVNHIRRSIFKKTHQARQMFKLFYSLLRVFHDGIILTHEDDIVFQNKRIAKIAETDPFTASNP